MVTEDEDLFFCAQGSLFYSS